MELRENKLRFSSGREVYCYSGVVGLGLLEGGPTNRVYYGFDGEIPIRPVSDSPDGPGDALTAEECRELAEYMVAAWSGYLRALKRAEADRYDFDTFFSPGWADQ